MTALHRAAALLRGHPRLVDATVAVLVAVLSVLNAGLYTSSRLLHVLSSNREAPAWLARKSSRGVPIWGVAISTLVGYGCVVIAALWPDTVFQFLLDSSGAVFLFVYLMICLSQLKLRKQWEREGTLKFKMWLHPWLPLLVTAAIVAVLISMGINPATRLSLGQCLIAIAAIVIAYGVMRAIRPTEYLPGRHVEPAPRASTVGK